MFSKENINHSSKKAKTIINNNFSNIYNHNNYSEIVNQKYPKSIILNNTILNRSNIIKKREIILLSSDIIDKNSFNKESKFQMEIGYDRMSAWFLYGCMENAFNSL